MLSFHLFSRPGDSSHTARRTAIALGVPFTAALLAAATAPPRASGDSQSDTIAIVDATVFTMTEASPRSHQTVVIANGKILTIGPMSQTQPPAGARIIDGREKFLTPGLIDGHVHLMDDADLTQFLAFGVTSIRIMMGSPHTLELRRAVSVGERVGPRIVSAGPLFADATVRWRDKIVPATPEAARIAVRAQYAAGYDFIKIYDGLTREIYAAIVDEAHALQMPIDGHIPQAVGFAAVLAAKQDLQHTDKTVFSLWGHQFDTTRVDSVAGAIKAAGVRVTPTIASMAQTALIGQGQFDALLARPSMRRIGDETLSFFCTVVRTMGGGGRRPASTVRYDPWADFQMRLIAAEFRAGVPIVAGTDTPNGMLAPGSGLIDELRVLGESGIPPMETLRAATRDAALALGDSMGGIIAPGARADLVLLDANPLTDSGAAYLDRIRGVMTAGRWLSREELDRLAPPRRIAPSCAK